MDENFNEKRILREMMDLNSQFASFLLYAKHSIEYINSKVEKIDNTFFTENQDIIHNLHQLYDYNHIDQIINNISENTRQLSDSLDYCCDKHDFIDDYTDTTFGNNIKITYCRLCNISKK